VSGDSLLLDTNAFIYFLAGRRTIADLVLQAADVCFSPITEIELLRAPHLTEEESNTIRDLLTTCRRIDLDQQVIDAAVDLSRRYGLRVPDAIIAGSALVHDVALVSADQHLARVTELTLIADITD
jgi:predicted nucleic acid-binding protein